MQLKPAANRKGRRPVVLIIEDGVGMAKDTPGNAVAHARMPVFHALKDTCLYTQLKAHGTAVGLPSDDDMGNSEVGHNALGAGRIFDQGAKLINKEIASGALFQGETWKALVSRVQQGKGTFHLIGLLSDGGVHSHTKQLFAMLRQAAADGVKRIGIHMLTDGRDVAGRSALTYLEQLEAVAQELQPKGCEILVASGGGRMHITMDRYNADWSMVERGWKTHVLGEGRPFASAKEAITTLYAEDPNVNDQYLPAFVIASGGKPVGPILDGDSVLFFNYRGDRAMEISTAFDAADFSRFDRVRVPKVLYAGMMEYDGDLHIPKHYLVNPPQMDRTLSSYLCGTGLKSYAISETQKYGHVTYFWNGNRTGYVDEKLEKYVEIPSDNVPFDQTPDMKAVPITEHVIQAIESGAYDFIRVNYPNGDMVGHTGVYEAAVQAMETVDRCLGQVLEALKKSGGAMIVLADHGNAEEMFVEKNGERIPKTSHTLNPVPCMIFDTAGQADYGLADVDTPGLANVAATICFLLGYDAPEGYAPSLIQEKT